MTMTTCPECEGQISDAAPVCVHCGIPLGPDPNTVRLLTRTATGFAVLGGIFLVIGAFLPWAEGFGDSLRGVEIDEGKLAAVMGVVLAVTGFLAGNYQYRAPRIIAIIAGFMGSGAAASVYDDMNEVGATDLAGPGLKMAALAGLVGAIAGFRRVKPRGAGSQTALSGNAVAKPAGEPQRLSAARVPDGGVPVRLVPNRNADPVGRVEGGLTVYVIERSGIWARIEADKGDPVWVENAALESIEDRSEQD